MKDGRAPRALCLVVAALVAGCTSTSSPSPSPPDPTPPPGATTLGAVQTAADVAKPATAISGVWSVVAHLHLAVYGVGPTTLLAGTDQPTSDGVYLYGAEIPLLAVMAGNATEPLTQFTQRIATAQAAADADVSQALSGAAENPFVAAHFQASKIDLSADPQVTPFDEWVAYFAAFDPRTGVPAARRVGGQARSAPPLSAARLDTIFRVTKQDFVDAMHTAVLVANITINLSPTSASLDMGVGGNGDTVTVTATVSWRVVETYNFGWFVRHGCHFNFSPGPLPAPLDLTFPAGSHPYFAVIPAGQVDPNNSGVGSFQVVALQDPGHGIGAKRVAARAVVAAAGNWLDGLLAEQVCPKGVVNPGRDFWTSGNQQVNLHIHYHGLPMFLVGVVSKITDNSFAPFSGVHTFTIHGLLAQEEGTSGVGPNGLNNSVKGSEQPGYTFKPSGGCEGSGGRAALTATSNPGLPWDAYVYFDQDAAGNTVNPRLVLVPPGGGFQGPSLSLTCPLGGQQLPGNLPIFGSYFAGVHAGLPGCAGTPHVAGAYI
jgi:hypothetical protein